VTLCTLSKASLSLRLIADAACHTTYPRCIGSLGICYDAERALYKREGSVPDSSARMAFIADRIPSRISVSCGGCPFL